MPNQFTTSIWGDEGFSAILSMKSIPEILRIIARDTSPPLWNLVEHIAFQLFGTSETVIRGLSLIFFLIAAFFVYKIGAHFWTKKTGLLASALTMLNPFFFIYAFEGRMYSIMAAGVAASMYFFLTKRWKLYVLATLWALYSHHFAFFALFVQGLWFLYEFLTGGKKASGKMFKAFLFVGLGYLPWLLPLYNQTKMVGGGFWLGTPTPKDLTGLISDYLAQGSKQLPYKLPFGDVKLYEISLYIVAAALVVRDWLKGGRKTVFLLMWFLVPILATWFISQKFQSIFFNRYLLYTIPGAMLILASNRRYPLSHILLAVTILLFAVTDYHYFTHPTKLPFRELSNYVKENRQEGDFLINWNAASHHLWETKYYGIPAPIYIPAGGELPYFVGTALMEPSDTIRSIPSETQRVGVVTSGPPEEVVISGYRESETKSFGNLKFLWYSKITDD